MASVTLNRVIIAPASDLSNALLAGSTGMMGDSSSVSGGGTARADTRTTSGAVRQYAGGRFRNISTVGVNRVYTVTLRILTWDQVGMLESWLNQVCLIRDRIGRRLWGTFSAMTVVDYPNSPLHDVAFVFTEVTWNEAA